MDDAARFNPYHAKAGSPTGGQFAASSGGSGSGTAKAPAGKTGAPPVTDDHGAILARQREKARLLAQAHKDEQRARELEKELHTLQQQEHAAVAAAKKSAAHAAAAQKASHAATTAAKTAAAHARAAQKAAAAHHTAAHKHHTAAHHKHTTHAKTLKQRITSLQTEIHGLRVHAAALEKQANAIRSGDSGIPGVFPHQLATWWEHGEGAAKIRWGQGGDFDRCVRLAVEEAHMDPGRAKGFCAERHHAALGIWPATHAAMEHAGRADMAATATKAPYGDVTYADPGYQSDKKKRYPLDSEAHCRAAWSYINMPKNAAQYSSADLAAIKGRIKAALKKYGADVSSDSSSNGNSRAEYMRLYPLEDIHILRSADGGDGRTVEAFAAVFDDPAEIQDHEGHYVETIDRSAFNKVIADASRARGGFPGSVKVLYNHGMTIQGTPSERFSMPIGVPVDIRAEQRGLLTRTRYADTPLAEEILENIRAGSITSQSFTGRIVRSDPQLRRGDRHRPDSAGNLRTVRRTELGLREYGPVLWPAYSGAEILGVRMSTPGTWEPDDEQVTGTSPDEEAAAGEPLTPEGEHSARYHQHALYLLRAKEQREAAGLVW